MNPPFAPSPLRPCGNHHPVEAVDNFNEPVYVAHWPRFSGAHHTPSV
jgi:hypothetical protein